MTVLAAALALALAAQDPAAAAPKQAPPPPRPPPDFRVPGTRSFTLDNGLAVTLVEMGQLPKATVALVLRAGTGDDPLEKTGLSSFLGALLTEGTTTRSAADIAAAAARWGGAIETNVTPDETVVGGTVLSEFAPELVALVADVALNPAFPPREVERVRQDTLRAVTIARTQPQVLAQERFLASLYPDHPYGRLLPTPEIVRGYTVDEARAFHRASYGARRAHLYVAGRFDRAATEARIRAALAAMPPGAPREPTPPRPASRRAVELVPRPGAVQSSLYLGLPVLDPRHPDYLRLAVANTLLGGYFSSRITANIREAKGYTYSPYSLVSVRAGTGYWAQVADVTTAVTGASLKEIFAEVERLRAAPPGADELRAVQAYLAGTFVLQTSDRDGLIARLRFVDLHGLGERWLEEYVKNVRAVTPADAQRMAQAWLDPARITVVVVGDPALVTEQVRPFGEIVTAPAAPQPDAAAPSKPRT
ncbi:pitrilysin family protein [Anaeromyxobacter sp. Fw109-5]|uniref:M16 family metallopeptidase n=1 Tax=Anaeromyxobacter sp. (strain Fw109-5) TaxID=404589 RepID=UPI000158A709|nr:pitrilysin family protein [Anaeromyxobacter sp. Fw109-5]ABS24302.1 peptidase M16 domain protein [Anaeromyxobacter sp. Fw109-5]